MTGEPIQVDSDEAAANNLLPKTGSVEGREMAMEPAETPLLIRDTGAAALAEISRATLHRLRAAGKWGPRPIRLGRCLRFSRDECLAWLAAGAPDARTWAAMTTAGRRRIG